jgi:hypothetical protein
MNRLRRRFTLALLLAAGLGPATPRLVDAQEPERGMAVRKLGEPGPYEIIDSGRPVLRYNYQVVAEPPEVNDRISAENRKYAVTRSDYIHPLYGPHGEILTDDWVPDHPHHRGIYWAWPEVDWNGRRGDLHALQHVLARPTGKIETATGPDHAEIRAENRWCWDDGTPIVREQATIRVAATKGTGRPIDLSFTFTALAGDVLVARRGQTHYGGLNIRLAPAEGQEIATRTDPPSATPRRASATRSGIPRGGRAVVSLSVVQDPRNPDFPGDWVQFPEISWVQPTFPASGTRYTIGKDRPLTLHYRLWVHEGKPAPETLTGP